MAVLLLALARGRCEEDRITEADVLDIVTRQRALSGRVTRLSMSTGRVRKVRFERTR